MAALSTHKIQAGKDTITKKLTLSQAIDARDALAKFIYARLFNWLVEQVNKSLEVGKRRTGRSISILDIYGFESFKNNSFEQFCINYANERLQQHFNRHLFKLEQEVPGCFDAWKGEGCVVYFSKLPVTRWKKTTIIQQKTGVTSYALCVILDSVCVLHSNIAIYMFQEYELDGIDWTKVDFEDNQVCLDLFEKKPLGLFSLLDEESNFPRATDLTLANKLKQHLHTNPCFKEERGRAFGVCHYAGEVSVSSYGPLKVLYDTSGFLEKNRDPLPSGSIQLLSSCSCELLQLFSKTLNQPQKQSNNSYGGALDSQKQSVGTKFKEYAQLESTTPHFIRCIKTNTKQLPGIYDQDLVLQQLKCCGVLEVVRISRAGYPTRMTHQEFSRRYGFLLCEANTSPDPLSISVAVLQQFNIPPEMYQVGFTKLYLRTGQIGALENRRKHILQGVIEIQRSFRGYQARCHYHELKKGVTTLQSFVRGEIGRREYGVMVKSSMIISAENIKEMQAATTLQSVTRGWLVRRDADGLNKLKKSPESARSRRRSCVNFPEDTSSERVQNLPSALDELQRRVVKAEATIEQREEENAELKDQLKQFESRWIDYEKRMKSMEDVWQKQMASLQTSLAAARKSLASENASNQHARRDVPSPFGYDSEDSTSMGSRTPGVSTPLKYCGSLSEAGRRRDGPATLVSVSHLMKEFDQRRQTFDFDARALAEARAGQPCNSNSIEELRKLKHRFEAWKKDYKARLKETKARLQKVANTEMDKRRKWWGKLSSKAHYS
ncbi:unnamed protein product [Sphenostylis stenocarpa]|uniref:Myosin motor domain-containing protein n=1 Tax=Sphenostylis stenocarpa TaxID=92480 RepID=A0AA86VIB8_9FABA|nr:unnamed protein product [Sphenostylis stenocarpa]